eukprot:scaffold330633_cov91-Tisochrysis_lutea.AAC.1
MRNICSDKPKVRVKSLNDREFSWGEPFLARAIEQVRQVVSFVTSHQKALARYRELCAQVACEARPE